MGRERKFDGVRASPGASTIEIDFTFAGRRCRERIKLDPSPANLKRASLHRAAILDAIARGTFDYAVTFPDSKNAARFGKPKDDKTVATFIGDWLDRKEKQLKASTWNDYRKTVNGVLVPGLGSIVLAELTKADVRKFCGTLTAGNKRIANVLSVLRAALTEAADDGLIETNPVAGWVYRNVEPPKEIDDVDPFTADEQAAILSKLSGQGRNLFAVAFWSGLRTSELVALEWRDIDFDAGVIRVRRAITQAGDEPETTKTRSGRRDVKINAPALVALTDQKAFTLLTGAEVFQNPRTGERWTGDQPIRKTLWTGALKKAGVRYRNPYQTRHTFASMMLSAGESPMWVAAQMGHADWGMIRKVYGRYMPEAEPNAGEKGVAVFGRQMVDIYRKTA